MYVIQRSFWLFIGLVLLWSGCKKFNADGVSVDNWSPDVAAPLFTTSVTVEDLLESYKEEGASIEEDMSGRLTLVYTNEGYSVDLAELFEVIPNIEFPLPDNVFPFPYELPNNIDIHFINIKSGIINYEILSPFFQQLNVTLRIPQIAKDGIIFEETFPVGFLQNNGSFDVSDYVLTPTNDTLFLEYEAYDASNGDTMDLDGLVGLEFLDLKHSYAQGYLGMGTYETPRDTIEVDFFDYFSSGTVFFEEPSLEVKIRNSFGFPVRMLFNILQAETSDGNVIPLANAQLADGIDFNYPTLSEVGQTKETSFVIDQNNSNLENMIGQPIRYLDYEVEPVANPLGDTSIIGFLTDTSAFSVDVELQLPLYGRAQNFAFTDTFDVDFSELDFVNSATLKLVTENGFPMDVYMQLAFLDEDGVVIDEILNPFNHVMTAAPVDGDGRTISTSRKETFAPIEDLRFRALRNQAKFVVLQGKFSTTMEGTESIRVYKDYEVTAKLGIIANVDPL